MAFDDSPVVDESSKASEKSVLATRGYFSKDNGFISREESSDMGIDLEVELILDGKNASGAKFPIQVKSDQAITLVAHDGKDFISYPFKTSRLGYLCRRTPAYGVIVIYDDGSSIAYYDYVEDVVSRVTDQRNSDDWKKQESVNINIPVENILVNDSVKGIHEKFRLRFENHALMLQDQGSKYAIPTFFFSEQDKTLDLESPEKVVEFLLANGLALFNQKEYRILDGLLNRLPFQAITQSGKLCLLAVLTYSSVGRYVEAGFFIKRSRSFLSDFSPEEVCILDSERAHVDYILGNISAKEYLSKLNDSVLRSNGIILLNLRLRVLHLKLLVFRIDDEEFEQIFQEISDLMEVLDKQNIPDEFKYHYKANFASELLLLMTIVFTGTVGRFKIREFISPIPLEERLNAVKCLIPILKVSEQIFSECLNYAQKQEDAFLIASISYSKALSFFLFDLINVTWGKVEHIDKAQCKSTFDLAMYAYGYFSKNQMMDHAYNALGIAYDANRLHKYLFGESIQNVDEGGFIKVLRHLEQSMGIGEFVSQVDDMAMRKEAIDRTNPAEEIMRMSDSEIEKYASDYLRYMALPKERLTCLINDLKIQKEACKALEGTSFELQQNLSHARSRETLYRDPIIYILVCKKCGFRTIGRHNLDELLNERRLLHPHVCL